MKTYAFVTCVYVGRTNNIIVWGRSNEGRRQFEVYGFEPYFYVPSYEKHKINLKNPLIKRTEKGLVFLTAPLKRVKTVRIVCYKPDQVPKLRKDFDLPLEADVPFTRRFLIDRGITDHFSVKRVADKIKWDEIGVEESIFAPFDHIIREKWKMDYKGRKAIKQRKKQ